MCIVAVDNNILLRILFFSTPFNIPGVSFLLGYEPISFKIELELFLPCCI